MYAEYAAPMTAMLKGNQEETKKGSKKALVWNEESDRAFEGMKQALLSAVGLLLALVPGPRVRPAHRQLQLRHRCRVVTSARRREARACGILELRPGGRPEADLDAP